MSRNDINLQDSFLNQVRKDNTEIQLVLLDGNRLNGFVRGFDNFTVVMSARGNQHLIYKHAIAQIISRRPQYHPEQGQEPGAEGEAPPAGGEGAEGEAATGPEGQPGQAPREGGNPPRRDNRFNRGREHGGGGGGGQGEGRRGQSGGGGGGGGQRRGGQGGGGPRGGGGGQGQGGHGGGPRFNSLDFSSLQVQGQPSQGQGGLPTEQAQPAEAHAAPAPEAPASDAGASAPETNTP